MSEGEIQGLYATFPARVVKPVAQTGCAPTLGPRLRQRILVQGVFDLLREPTPNLLLSDAWGQALGFAIEKGDVCQVSKIQNGQMFPSFGPEGVQQGHEKSAIPNTPTPPLQGGLKGLEVERVVQGAHSF